jgi:hypothetical protein
MAVRWKEAKRTPPCSRPGQVVGLVGAAEQANPAGTRAQTASPYSGSERIDRQRTELIELAKHLVSVGHVLVRRTD